MLIEWQEVLALKHSCYNTDSFDVSSKIKIFQLGFVSILDTELLNTKSTTECDEGYIFCKAMWIMAVRFEAELIISIHIVTNEKEKKSAEIDISPERLTT